MELKLLPLETRLKLISVAQDVIDRDGLAIGVIHAMLMRRGAEEMWVNTRDVQACLFSGWEASHPDKVSHCTYGALEQAALEHGEIDELSVLNSEVYNIVNTLFGIPQGCEDQVYGPSDAKRPEEALSVVKRFAELA